MTTEEPTDYEKFVGDATKRAALKALLANPILEEAMTLADELMRPHCGTPADANQALTVAKFHQSAGAHEFMKKLDIMTREPKQVVRPAPRRLAQSEDDLPKTDPR